MLTPDLLVKMCSLNSFFSCISIARPNFYDIRVDMIKQLSEAAPGVNELQHQRPQKYRKSANEQLGMHDAGHNIEES